jgi:hypothetical protein
MAALLTLALLQRLPPAADAKWQKKGESRKKDSAFN